MPKISIVTPSFNQGEYIEETIRSVLLQDYPNLEYIVIDGGSTDQTVEILEKYEPWISFWESKPDDGQTHAINKGFSRATGDWIAWLNSDDLFLPGALRKIGLEISQHSSENWLVGTTVRVDSQLNKVDEIVTKCDFESWMDYFCTKQSQLCLPQTSSFWSMNAWQATGSLNESLNYVMDFEYWGRLARAGFRPKVLSDALAMFRIHEGAKTHQGRVVFWREELLVIDALAEELSGDEKEHMVAYKEYLVDRINNFSQVRNPQTLKPLLQKTKQYLSKMGK